MWCNCDLNGVFFGAYDLSFVHFVCTRFVYSSFASCTFSVRILFSASVQERERERHMHKYVSREYKNIINAHMPFVFRHLISQILFVSFVSWCCAFVLDIYTDYVCDLNVYVCESLCKNLCINLFIFQRMDSLF